MSKFCTNCGAQTEDNALFCPECGTRFEEQLWKPQQENLYEQPTVLPQQNPYDQAPVQPQQNYYQSGTVQPYGQNQYYTQPVQPLSKPAARAKRPGRGFGIASLILGIFAAVNGAILMLLNFATGLVDVQHDADGAAVALGLSIAIVFFVVIVGIMALLSLIFGIVSLVKGNKGTAITGLVLSVLSVAVCVFSIVTVVNMDKAKVSDVINDNIIKDIPDLDNDLKNFEDWLKDY